MLKITAEQIYRHVVDNPGLKASKIAATLGTTRKEVNSLIYNHLRDRLVRDDNYCWYVVSSSAKTLAPEKEKIHPKPVTTIHKDVECIDAYIRGNSLFRIKHHHDKMVVESNLNHPFVSKILVGIGGDGETAFSSLLEAFSLAAEKHYNDADLIEELIDDWGTILVSKLNGGNQ